MAVQIKQPSIILFREKAIEPDNGSQAVWCKWQEDRHMDAISLCFGFHKNVVHINDQIAKRLFYTQNLLVSV